VLTADPPPPGGVAVPPDRSARVQRRLPTCPTVPIPHRAADDVRAGWDWLCTEQRLDPTRIVVAGDSAGGHLAVDLLLQPDVAHPAGLALFSPLVDLTFALARTREDLRRDPAIRAADAARRSPCTAREPISHTLA